MENNRDFDDIDAMINILNQGKEPRKKENKASINNDINDPDWIVNHIEETLKLRKIEQAVNSKKGPIELAKEKRQLEKKKKELRQKEIKLLLKRSVVALSLAATITGGATLAAKVVPKLIDNKKINEISDDLTDKAKYALLIHDLATETDKDGFKMNNNSVDDYSALDADTPMEVYAYRKAISIDSDNANEEFNKFIRSVTYDDGLYNYESYEQFLRINGYYDQTTNKVSSEVFYNYMEATILEAYKNSTVSSYEEEFYSFDLGDESHKTR